MCKFPIYKKEVLKSYFIGISSAQYFIEQLDIASTNKIVPTTLARCEDEEKQCLSG